MELPPSRGRRSPPELFTHYLTLAPLLCYCSEMGATPPSLGTVCADGGEPGEDYRSESGAAVPCGRCPLYRKRPEPSDFDGLGGVGLDEIDVIGRYRRRRRCTPNAHDNLACVGMKIGFVAVSGFSERPDTSYNEGDAEVWKRWVGDGCGEKGVGNGMEAFGRDGHGAEPAGRNAVLSTSTWPNWRITQKSLTKNHRRRGVDPTPIFPAEGGENHPVGAGSY